MVRINDIMRKIARKNARQYKQAVRVNAEQDNYNYLCCFDEWCEQNGVAPWKEKNMFDKMLNDTRIKYMNIESFVELYK